jgi:GT2 family glycosyltransferase
MLVGELGNRADVEIVLSPSNLGYFAGLNLGLSVLKSTWSDCDVAVIGNNDLEFPVGFADSVSAVREQLEKYPVVSPRIRTLEGREQNPHVVHSVSVLRERMYDAYHSSYSVALALKMIARVAGAFGERGDEESYERRQEIWQGHGSCYLVGPVFFREFGSLPAPTLLFGEEYFLAEQLESKGYSILYEPSVLVTHACHSSVGRLPGRRQWELSRKAHEVYRDHYPIEKVKLRRAHRGM